MIADQKSVDAKRVSSSRSSNTGNVIANQMNVLRLSDEAFFLLAIIGWLIAFAAALGWWQFWAFDRVADDEEEEEESCR